MICSKCQTAFLCKVYDTFICSDQKCRHPELTPLSFEPEFPSSKDDQRPKSAHHSRPDHSELTTKDMALRKCNKEIKDACHILQYSECIGNLAMSIALSAVSLIKLPDDS